MSCSVWVSQGKRVALTSRYKVSSLACLGHLRASSCGYGDLVSTLESFGCFNDTNACFPEILIQLV